MPAGRSARQRRTRFVASLTSGVAMFLVAALATPIAGAESLLGPSVEVPAPPNATSVPHASLEGIACTATNACVAVGSYENTSRAGVPMVAIETAFGWSRATTVLLPANHARAYSAAGLLSVACPAKGSCVAVGSYEDTSRSVLPMLSAQAAGTWGVGFSVALPATAGGNQLASLTSVSCVAVGTCTAVGTFTDQHSTTMLMAVSATSGSWGAATEIALPAGAGTVRRALGAVGLAGVSCVDAKDCVAVGSFLDSAGAIVPLRVAETSGTWRTAVRAALPKGSAVVGSAALDSVSCSAVGDCVAVGYATNAANRIEPVVERETAGKWSQVIAIGLPKATPTASGAMLDHVACTARGSCTAVGGLTTADGSVVPIVLVDAGGRWQPLQRLASLPAADPHARFSELTAVSCPATDACVSVGGVGANSPDGVITSSTSMATRITPVRPVRDPAPPSRVTPRPGPGELKVTWVPGSDGGSPISSFTAAASPADGSCTSTTPSCTISGLHDGARYRVVVTATNAHGTSRPSAPSPSQVPGVAPSAPGGLRVTRSHDRAVLRWRASTASPGDPVTRYVVTAVGAGAPARSCSTAATSCALEGLIRGDAYTVWVVASNAVGQSSRSASLRFRSL